MHKQVGMWSYVCMCVVRGYVCVLLFVWMGKQSGWMCILGRVTSREQNKHNAPCVSMSLYL